MRKENNIIVILKGIREGQLRHLLIFIADEVIEAGVKFMVEGPRVRSYRLAVGLVDYVEAASLPACAASL